MHSKVLIGKLAKKEIIVYAFISPLKGNKSQIFEAFSNSGEPSLNIICAGTTIYILSESHF